VSRIRAICESGSGPLEDTESVGALTLDFQLPELWKIISVVYKSSSLWYFVAVAGVY
jgi:hypothetical protein